MSFEADATRGVKNHYGPRTTGKGLGRIRTAGSEVELTVDLTGDSIGSLLNGDVYLPAGALPTEWFLDVSEAFSVSAAATLDIGTDGSEATNGLEITEALLEAVGTTKSSTFAGTWAASLAAETLVGHALTGTVSDDTIGKARLVIRYINVAP
jgi:hypothetical protein